jgi:hypothetical protein
MPKQRGKIFTPVSKELLFPLCWLRFLKAHQLKQGDFVGSAITV